MDDLHVDALSRLYTLKTFKERLGPLCLPHVTLSERDCAVLATYLSRKGWCGFDGEVRVLPGNKAPQAEPRASKAHVRSRLQVIRFIAPHTTPSASNPIVISSADRSTLSLLASLASLSASITSLEARITAARSRAAAYASQKRPELAKAALIEKRREEKLLEERVGQRLKVQEVVAAIERAVGDEEVSHNGYEIWLSVRESNGIGAAPWSLFCDDEFG